MSNKRIVVLNLCIAALIVGLWYMISNWEQWDIGYKFVATFFCAVVFGILFVLFVLPRIGEGIGAFFYSAPDKIEADVYTKAAAKVTQGDYEGAIVAYRKIADDEPENRFPIVEIAKIQRDHLGEVDAAIETFEEAIESKLWSVDDAAAMIFQLENIYLHDKQNAERAKELLEMIIERFPETRHSANAHHRLNELVALGGSIGAAASAESAVSEPSAEGEGEGGTAAEPDGEAEAEAEAADADSGEDEDEVDATS